MQPTSCYQNALVNFSHRRYPKSKREFPAHSHNEYELIFFLDGDVSYIVENRKYRLNKYDMIITRPKTHHSLLCNSECEYERFNILLPPDGFFAEILCTLSEEQDVIHCGDSQVIVENFKKLDAYADAFSPDAFSHLRFALLTEICYSLQTAGKELFAKAKPLPPVIQKSLAYINRHLSEIRQISEISDALFISKNYFFRIFKEELKISPKKYITNKRLLHAQTLLVSGEKPTAVYLMCGFENYITFYKQYVELFGYPPSMERRG